MSDDAPEVEDVPEWDEANDPDHLTRKDVQSHDVFLDALLGMTVGLDDDGQGGFGVTLIVDGLVVAGTTVSRKVWMEGVLDDLRNATGNITADWADVVEGLFTKFADRTVEIRTRREEAKLPQPRRRYIHLSDVVIVTSDGYVTRKFWRGSVDSIGGWSLGRIDLD